MKSPFPGMDPFIEGCGLWSDFDTKLIGEIERMLAVTLPERYFIQTGERFYLVFGRHRWQGGDAVLRGCRR